MEAPFKLLLPTGLQNASLSHKLPAACEYPIHYARPTFISMPRADILHQVVSSPNCHLDLYSYEIKKRALVLHSLVSSPVVTFCYGLKGQVSSIYQSRANKDEPKDLLANQYSGLYLPKGTYLLTFEKGSHVFFCITLRQNYLKWISNQYPSLSPLIKALITQSTAQVNLPPCRIDFSIKRIIKRLQSCTKKGNALTSVLHNVILKLLAIYHEQLQSGNFLAYKTGRETAYEVKDYIEANYTDPSCQVNLLTEKFHITRRTISREFKAAFGTNAHDLIMQLRMKLALQLLSSENMLVKDAAAATGYLNTSSFSRAFTKYYKYPPSDVRKVEK